MPITPHKPGSTTPPRSCRTRYHERPRACGTVRDHPARRRSPWTQRARPQGAWKTAKNAVSHRAHSHLSSPYIKIHGKTGARADQVDECQKFVSFRRPLTPEAAFQWNRPSTAARRAQPALRHPRVRAGSTTSASTTFSRLTASWGQAPEKARRWPVSLQDGCGPPRRPGRAAPPLGGRPSE